MISQTHPFIRVELHVHTRGSKDSLVKPEKLLARCDRLGIDRFAVTDHNAIETALQMKADHPDRVIVGEEIETTRGEMIGYFMNEWIPPGLEPMDVIERLRAQGAVISVAHPFDATRSAHWSEQDLLAITPFIDAIEIFNARCLSQSPNLKAADFAEENGLLGTVGSDAHSLWEMGRATLQMPDFSDAVGFCAALKQAQHLTQLSSPLVHLFSRFAVFYKKMVKFFQ